METVFIFYSYKNLDCLLKNTSNPRVTVPERSASFLKPSPVK